ncbi:MAG: LD-carboxypeptidase [Ignavibacteriales bacterium]|nr:LD-carboxypeptidase [Ignavibacteriales bacterium]
MNRSEFITSAALLALMPGSMSASGLADDNLPIIKPNRLRFGDTIGLVAPAGFITGEEMQESVDSLTKLGFKVKTDPSTLNRNGYFAGTDKDRAQSLMAMFADTNVHAIMCIRGGYGAARILPMLDYTVIRNNPKALIGYSDITALHAALYKHAGLVSFHGPVGTSTYNEFSVDNFLRVVVTPRERTVFVKAQSDGDKPEHLLTTIRSGKAEGKLVGGNLSIVASLIGTAFDVSYKGCMVYLEEVGEEPYRIDRMLTQMIQAGKFEGIAGIAMGIFKNCQPKEKESGIGNSFTLIEILMDRLYHLNVPVIYGLSFGHVENKLMLPYGIKAELDTSMGTLSLTERAVM